MGKENEEERGENGKRRECRELERDGRRQRDGRRDMRGSHK